MTVLVQSHKWIPAPGGQGCAEVCGVCGAKGQPQARDAQCEGKPKPQRQQVTRHDYDPLP